MPYNIKIFIHTHTLTYLLIQSFSFCVPILEEKEVTIRHKLNVVKNEDEEEIFMFSFNFL